MNQHKILTKQIDLNSSNRVYEVSFDSDRNYQHITGLKGLLTEAAFTGTIDVLIGNISIFGDPVRIDDILTDSTVPPDDRFWTDKGALMEKAAGTRITIKVEIDSDADISGKSGKLFVSFIHQN